MTTDMSSVECFHGEDHESMPSIRQLRAICWRGVYEQGGSLEDGYDAEAIHWIVRNEHKLVAAARLTIHQNLLRVPDIHLFSSVAATFVAFPAGFISRLIVHPENRSRGIARHLDALRIAEALAYGCKTLIVVFNPISGEGRRQQLLGLGFRSFDNETAQPDGAFGASLLYFLDLESS